MDDFFVWFKKHEGYPHLSFSDMAMEYMSTVLGLKIDITENLRSQ